MPTSNIILLFALAHLVGWSIVQLFFQDYMWFVPLIISSYGVGVLIAEWLGES